MESALKRELRTFAGVRSIREAKRLFGISNYTNDRAYRYLLNLYEPVQRQRRADTIAQRNAEYRKNIALANIRNRLQNLRQKQIFNRLVQGRRRRNALPIEDWSNFIRQQRQNRLNTPFTLRLRSAIVFGLTRDFNFSNFFQFNNWVEAILNQQIDGDSETIVRYRNIINELDNRDAFRDAILEVLPLAGGCNKQKTATTGGMTGEYHNFQYYNPPSQYNNCGLACLEYLLETKLDYKQIRKKFGLKNGEMIDFKLLNEIYISCGGDKFLVCIDDSFSLDYREEYSYLHIRKNHYRVITSFGPKYADDFEILPNGKKKRKKVHRKLLAYDFETRIIDPTNCDTNKYRIKTGQSYRYMIKDTICSIHYQTKQGTTETKTFITNNDKSSARQFIDWLCDQHKRNNHYLVVAHNGARFDNIILQSAMSEAELLHNDPQYRGYSLIGMTFYNHIFRDPCCFLVGSLDTLCKNFKVVNGKKTTNIYNGMDNKQLCFYRPDLTIIEFLDLQQKEPAYWKEYVDYCEVDCISLMELWSKFVKETTGLIQKMGAYGDNDGKWILRKVSVASRTTIGGLAKKLIETLNPVVSKSKYNAMEKYLKFVGDDEDKYHYVCKFKRGGISHCNQAGKHNESVAGIDITSQYPTALKYMVIPSGESKWVDAYDKSRYGYYTIKNLKWDNDRKFRPICKANDRKNGESLDWTTNWEEDTLTYVDSELIKYCVKYLGLVSFDVVEGLVSDYYLKGERLFGKYVNVLFEEKARQDTLKGTSEFNNAYREVCKLFMNSLTGKLVEDPSNYFQLKYALRPDNNKDNINGIGFNKDRGEELKMNIWVNAGVMVYSYSKRILWEYIRFLPDQSNDIIHIETDGLYFPAKFVPALREAVSKENYKGDYANAIGFGSDLGNVKVEHISKGESYWLGKKFYYMFCGEENRDVIKIKGVPTKTIDKHGTTIQVVSKEDYISVYNGESVSKEFSTLYKKVFGKTEISNLVMSRRLNPMCVYNEYN